RSTASAVLCSSMISFQRVYGNRRSSTQKVARNSTTPSAANSAAAPILAVSDGVMASLASEESPRAAVEQPVGAGIVAGGLRHVRKHGRTRQAEAVAVGPPGADQDREADEKIKQSHHAGSPGQSVAVVARLPAAPLERRRTQRDEHGRDGQQHDRDRVVEQRG